MAEDKENQAPSASAPSSGGKLIPILTIVNVLVTMGMVAVLLMQHGKNTQTVAHIQSEEHGEGHAAEGGDHGAPSDSKDEHGKAAGNKFGRMVTLDQFTVNLSTIGSVSPKFVRVNISLEVPNEDSEQEVIQKMPQVRNAVIDLFNSKRPSDLQNVEGRSYVREEIKNAINSFMVTGKVKGVFFTSFVVSS